MKVFPYVLSAMLLGFSGLSGDSDHASHSVTIFIRRVDKLSVDVLPDISPDNNSFKQFLGQENYLTWFSTQYGKKITVQFGRSAQSGIGKVKVVKCTGGVIAESSGSFLGARELILNTDVKGECFIKLGPFDKRHTNSSEVIYTITDSF